MTRSGESAKPTGGAGVGGAGGTQGTVAGETMHPHESPIDFEKLYVGMEFFDDVKRWTAEARGGH